MPLNEPIWSANISAIQALQPPDKFYAWLIKPNSISQEMRKLCTTFHLQLLSQQINTPYKYEANDLQPTLLSQIQNEYLIREIFLYGNTAPWSFGRVAIPATTYAQYKTIFDNLGDNLIGETFLYQAHSAYKISRGDFAYACIDSTCKLHANINAYLPVANRVPKDTSLWARKSIFYVSGYSLLITDILLPTIPEYPLC